MPKLDALTFLRFLAAVAIVFHHMKGYFGIPSTSFSSFPFDQAVAFFFVLSGFIMMYVYPSLDEPGNWRKFYASRFARIWPAHATSFLLILLLIFLQGFTLFDYGGMKTALANLGLIHAWIPMSNKYFSFNSPSWSISTECFFYLCYPLLLRKWSMTWYWKLCLAFALPMCLIFVCAMLHVPDFSELSNKIDNHGVLYIHPLSRIFDFVFGMTLAFFWKKGMQSFDYSFTVGTIVETIILILVFFNMYYAHEILNCVSIFIPQLIVKEFKIWAIKGFVSIFSFSALICIMASEKGLISHIFKARFLVILGELSFTIYLIHQIVIRYYIHFAWAFITVPAAIQLFSFILIVIAISFCIYFFIEQPLRKVISQFLILKPRPFNGSKTMQQKA